MRCGYGTYVPASPATPTELREEIALCEASGFDAIFFSEHHGVEGYAPDPLGLAVYALGQTSVLRAGPMPLLLPLHNPVRVAETAGLANFLSGGRLMLGVSAGYLEQDYGQIGIPLGERGGRMREAMEVLRLALGGGGGQHHGPFYTFQQDGPLLHLGPDGGPELWMASSSSVGINRAARWCDGLMLNSLLSADEARPLIAQYREQCRERGRQPGKIGIIRRAWFGSTDESEAFVRSFEGQLKGHVNYANYAAKAWVEDLSSRSWVQDVVFTGAPDEVAEMMLDWGRPLGIEYVMLKLHWGQRDFAQITEQLRRAKDFAARLQA